MELSSPELIRDLLATFGNTSLVRRPRAAGGKAPTGKHRRVPCRCGQCRQCVDNVRWERIFAEKFADPDYYTRRVIHIGSSLTSL
jgi:hypothetical protein